MLGIKDTKLKEKLFLFSRTPLSNGEARHINKSYMLVNAVKKKTVGKERWLGHKGDCVTLFGLKASQRTSRLN